MKKNKRLFKNAAVFTDIHFGEKHNSRVHNNDCEAFVIWFCEEAKKRGCDTCIMMGDWHHHRNTINVSTLNYTNSNLKRLSEAFDHVYIIIGNHDLYYREKREINSLPMAEYYSNITLVNEIINDGDVVIVPWIIENEWKKVIKLKCKYMFGHFELPGFKLNAMIDMPDHGGLNRGHFRNQEAVFSGHFHKRQQGQNVTYIGNPFGHNFADAWDFDRGCMFLKWDEKPEFVNWEDGPKYITAMLSDIVGDPPSFLLPNSYIKAYIDIELSYEEVNFIKDTFTEQFNIRELKLMPVVSLDEDDESELDGKFETVDSIVISELDNIDSQQCDKNVLIEIYNNLHGEYDNE